MFIASVKKYLIFLQPILRYATVYLCTDVHSHVHCVFASRFAHTMEKLTTIYFKHFLFQGKKQMVYGSSLGACVSCT